jgi:hypothetical protein
LTRRLYEAGFSRKDILELYRLVDWLMRLPDGLERAYKEQLNEYENRNKMPYVTSIQQLGREEGLQMGREEGLQTGRLQALREAICETIEARFGEVPAAVGERVNAMEDAARLKELHRLAVVSPSLTEFESALLQ